MKANPDYVLGNGEPYYILDDEEYDAVYGPYATVGAARGVETHEAYKSRIDSESGEPRSEYQRDVVDSWVEKIAEIVWERI